MKNDGKDAEKAFTDYWEAVGHVERLRDARDLMGINGGRRVTDFAKPSDFLVSAPGVPLHYAEVKSTIKPDSFLFSGIRPGQHTAAIKSSLRGDRAYTFYIFAYATGQWYTMSCTYYRMLHESGVRSVKFKDLELWLK